MVFTTAKLQIFPTLSHIPPQEVEAQSFHPRQASHLWTNFMGAPSLSTPSTPFVDEWSALRYFVHTRPAKCGLIACALKNVHTRPAGSDSMSFRIDAPVVVKPDTLSNSAFTRVNPWPYIRNGSMPNRQTAIHEPDVIAYLSLAVMHVECFMNSTGQSPASAVTSVE